ncbi:MAG: type II CAAX prenyl endopeptidase Rce1 family protein, partial [Flavobacteriales bacterium]
NMMVWDIPKEEIIDLALLEGHPHQLQIIKVLQSCSQVFGFLVAPLLFLFFFGKKSVDNYWVAKPSLTIFYLPILVILYIPVMEVLIRFNAKIIPAGSQLESYFKPIEERAGKMIETLLQMDGPMDLMGNLFIMAVLPAICEEFLFRGLIQGQLSKWFKNAHLGIWVTAFIFSAIHFQFYGFLPRLVLGAMFGYLLIHTGSIWTSVFAHFLHNGLSVLVMYYVSSSDQLTMEQVEQVGTTPFQLIIILAGLAVLGYTFLQRSPWEKNKKAYLHFESSSPSTPLQKQDHQEL